MKILMLGAMLALASCGSADNKTASGANSVPDIEVATSTGTKVSDKSFQKKKKITYSPAEDHYNTSSDSNVLANESANRSVPGDAKETEKMKDPLGSMMAMCYQKKFDEGFALAQTLFDTHVNLPTYWNQIATCHLLQGNERKALLFYNKALEVTPGYVPALNNIGVIYSKTNQDQKSLVALQKALSGGKFTKTPRYNLAFLLLRYGLADEAATHFRGLSEEAPQDPELRAGLANSLALAGKWENAWEEFNKVPDSLRKRADVGLNMALTAQKLGKSQTARDILSATNAENSDREYAEEIRQVVGE